MITTKYIFIVSLFLFLLSFNVSATEQWLLTQKEEGISVYLKKIKDSSLKAFKGEMTLKTKLSSIVAVLEDTKAYSRLLHNCKLAKNIELIGSNESYKYVVTSMPWPVLDRDIVIHSLLTQNKSNKQVTIDLKSVSDRVTKNKNMVRISTMQGRWLLTPISTGEIKVVYEMSIDPGGSIPKWLVNTLAVDIPFNTLLNLRKLQKNDHYRSISLAHIHD